MIILLRLNKTGMKEYNFSLSEYIIFEYLTNSCHPLFFNEIPYLAGFM